MTRLNSLLLASLLFAAAACTGDAADDIEDMNEVVAPAIIIAELPADSTLISSDALFNVDSLDVVATDVLDAELIESAGDICECTDQQCELDWVAASAGCDVCVIVECSGDTRRGGCVACGSATATPSSPTSVLTTSDAATARAHQ
jgi:hypothetical protein